MARLDRSGKRSRFNQARAVESAYNSQLRRVAQQVLSLLRGMTRGDKVDADAIIKALRDYSLLIQPWATSVAQYMVADIDRRNRKAWHQHSKELGQALRRELNEAQTGAAQRQLMEDSVRLITSLPRRAAEGVHELVQKNLTAGQRASTLIPKILDLGSKTEWEARRIARTETARASSVLTQARAVYVGSEGYIWRTAGDADVRDSHAEMEGKYVRWDTVPKLSDGTQAHAGQIYNCRCFAEPVLPDT